MTVLSVSVFGPESVSYERSRRENCAKFHEISARVFFVRISKSQDSRIYCILVFFQDRFPKWILPQMLCKYIHIRIHMAIKIVLFQYFQVHRSLEWVVLQYLQVHRSLEWFVFQYFQVHRQSKWIVFQYFQIPRLQIRLKINKQNNTRDLNRKNITTIK